MYAIFQSRAVFDAWHDGVKSMLGFPLIGVNQATGEPDLEHITSQFTEPLLNDNDPRVIANVGDKTEGLTVINHNDAEWADWFPKPRWAIQDSLEA